MYFLAERCLTSGVFADHIDPERTNPQIPQIVQQMELHYGVEQHFIRKTVGVAFELANPTYLPVDVDIETVLTIAVDVATALASVMDVMQELRDHQAETRAKSEAGQLTAAYVPRTPNLNAKVRQSLAALRDVEVAVKRLAGQFYRKDAPNDPWDKKLRPALQAKYGGIDGFQDWTDAAWRALESVADYRHAMIHPDDTKSVRITDYELKPEGAFVAPTIEIVHPRSPISRRDVVQFLESQVENIAEVFEAVLGYMCDLNVRTISERFHSSVAALPNGQQRNGSHLTWTTGVIGGLR